MKFRSWYLVLIGILLQAVSGLILLHTDINDNGLGAIGAAIGVAIAGIVIFLAASLGIVPLVLLLFHKTRKIGAITSIVFGVFGIVIYWGMIVGVFMLIAGVIALWRKK